MSDEKLLSTFIENLLPEAKLSETYGEANLTAYTNALTLFAENAQVYFSEALGRETLGFEATTVLIVRDLYVMRGDVQTAKALVEMIKYTDWDFAFQWWDFIIMNRVEGEVILDGQYPNDLATLNLVEMLQQANIAFKFGRLASF